MTPAMTSQRYRLVTRSDFDGLVCAALLKHLGMLDEADSLDREQVVALYAKMEATA